MRRPRIALWIKWNGPCWWYMPWLWRWAVRRVDRWHEGPIFEIGEDTSLGKIVEMDRNKSTITVQRMIHR